MTLELKHATIMKGSLIMSFFLCTVVTWFEIFVQTIDRLNAKIKLEVINATKVS